MKAFSLEKRHLRQAAIRKLTVASCIGGFLTFLFGAWIAPWIGAVGSWLLHQISWWHQAGNFPNLLSFVAAPNLLLGGIWLVYYLIVFSWAKATLSPRQKMELRAQMDREYREKYGEWGFNMWPTNDYAAGAYYQPPQPKPEEVPLSQAWPGELKHQLVEHCYEEYRKALKRYDPPPLDLKTPETFFYRKAGQIEWRGSTLVIPEAVLTPERIHELLPFLAHYLYDYNAEQMTVEDTHGFPDYVPFAVLLFITGNFLWLPVAYKHGTEEKVAKDSVAQQKQRVLDRDEFAVLLGQGPPLEHQLRRLEEDLKQRDEIDRNIPTFAERIGRLEVLNERERQEMRALGLSPKEPPLVIDSPFRQLKQGKKRKQ
jgi:hypothetical protein